MLRRLSVTTLCFLLLLVGLAVDPAAAAVPSKKQWVADTYQAMRGSRTYVGNRVERGGDMLAVNLDIDNTSLASHYAYGDPVAVTLRFAKYARAHGVKVLFNTGRVRGGGRLQDALRLLRNAGYRPTDICGRRTSSEGLTHSKQRCRRHFVNDGYTLIANVGNLPSDFTGHHYERAFRLPNYDRQLA